MDNKKRYIIPFGIRKSIQICSCQANTSLPLWSGTMGDGGGGVNSHGLLLVIIVVAAAVVHGGVMVVVVWSWWYISVLETHEL